MHKHVFERKTFLVVHCLKLRLKILRFYGDISTGCEGLRNLGLRWSFEAFGQGGISCHIYCDTGPRFLWSQPEDRPY